MSRVRTPGDAPDLGGRPDRMTAREYAVEGPAGRRRPLFAHWQLVLLVFTGGAIGTAGREGLSLVIPSAGGVPWALLTVNLVGALLLGFLLTALGRVAPESPRRRDVRLFAGTGIMGGFTTYSSLATDTVALFEINAALAAGYALVSVAA